MWSKSSREKDRHFRGETDADDWAGEFEIVNLKTEQFLCTTRRDAKLEIFFDKEKGFKVKLISKASVPAGKMVCIYSGLLTRTPTENDVCYFHASFICSNFLHSITGYI